MRFLRTMSTRRLLLAVVAAAVLVAAIGAIAVAAATRAGSPPPAKPLADALHDAAVAPKPSGITARVHFTNNLLPSTSGLGRAAPPLVAGADGRLWLRSDGTGRIELQSDAGDAQIVWSKTKATVYDASSNTVYELALPQQSSSQPSTTQTPPTVDRIKSFLTQLTKVASVSGANPTTIAGQGAYTVRVTPADTSSLFDGGTVGWDASRGVPLEVAIYARGDSRPVLALKADEISYGAVPAADVQVAPPANAKVVQIPTGSGGQSGAKQTPVTGLQAVQAALPFTLVAPDTLAGKARGEVRLVGKDAALVVYGKGLSSLAVLERQPGKTAAPLPAPLGGMLSVLPTVQVGGVSATELETPLGTVLRFEKDGVSFLVGASLPKATVESAAAGL